MVLLFDVLKEANSDNERASLFPKIDLSLGSLSHLFKSLLDISKLDAGAVEFDEQDLYVTEILDDLIGEFESEAHRKNLYLRVHAVNIVARSDRLLLERILRNLISNAVR